MVKSKQKADWERTAMQTTILANCWTGKNAKLHVTDFPYCGADQPPRIDTPEKFKQFIQMYWNPR